MTTTVKKPQASKTQVKWLPPTQATRQDLLALGTAGLVAYGEKGEAQWLEAGAELLRRQRNKQIRKAAEGAKAN